MAYQGANTVAYQGTHNTDVSGQGQGDTQPLTSQFGLTSSLGVYSRGDHKLLQWEVGLQVQRRSRHQIEHGLHMFG